MLEDRKLKELANQSMALLRTMEAMRDEAQRDWATVQRSEGAGSKKTRELAIVASELEDACREMKRVVTDLGSAATRVTMASMSTLAKEVADAMDQDAVKRVVAREVQRRLADKNAEGIALMELG